MKEVFTSLRLSSEQEEEFAFRVSLRSCWNVIVEGGVCGVDWYKYWYVPRMLWCGAVQVLKSHREREVRARIVMDFHMIKPRN
jgi:hypothetical protein